MMRTGQGNGGCHQRTEPMHFLSALPASTAREFEEIKVTTTYPSGAVLFVEGETPRGVFVLSSGRVKLSIGSANGKVMILRISKPGEILGLHAVVSGAAFQATAQTVESCKVSFVRSDEFLHFLRQHPQASLEAAKQLSFSYQEACDQLRAIGLCDSARQRVARFVLEWAANGTELKDGIRVTLTLTHEEIGQLIGTSRETVTRTFADFRSRRWILTQGTTLMVRNMRALQDLVGEGTTSSYESSGDQTASAARLYMNHRSSAPVNHSHSW